jgi:hypothetical protein
MDPHPNPPPSKARSRPSSTGYGKGAHRLSRACAAACARQTTPPSTTARTISRIGRQERPANAHDRERNRRPVRTAIGTRRLRAHGHYATGAEGARRQRRSHLRRRWPALDPRGSDGEHSRKEMVCPENPGIPGGATGFACLGIEQATLAMINRLRRSRNHACLGRSRFGSALRDPLRRFASGLAMS